AGEFIPVVVDVGYLLQLRVSARHQPTGEVVLVGAHVRERVGLGQKSPKVVVGVCGRLAARVCLGHHVANLVVVKHPDPTLGVSDRDELVLVVVGVGGDVQLRVGDG